MLTGMAKSSPRRTGRRPGPSRTRDAILRAARRRFGQLGYERTTLRGIAADAGVDPALVVHFFGSKQQLFLSVAELPFEPAVVLPELLTGDRSRVGERLARFVLTLLEDADARSRWTAIIRAAVSEPTAAAVARELLTRRVFLPLARELGSDDAVLRANLVGSQLVGLVMARHILRVEPLASVGCEELVHTVAPTLQRYLTAPL